MKTFFHIVILVLVCAGCASRKEEAPSPFKVDVERGPANQPSIRVSLTPEAQARPEREKLESEADLLLFRTQGYIEATDRFLQMDILRRLGLARLSELLPGAEAEKKDREIIGIGLPLAISRVAKRIFEDYRHPYYDYLEAFAAGVNDYIKEMSDPKNKNAHRQLLYARGIAHNGAYEFPQWEPPDSLAIAHNVSFYLSSSLMEKLSTGILAEIYRTLDRQTFGFASHWKKFLDLLDYTPVSPTYILEGTRTLAEERRPPSLIEGLPALPPKLKNLLGCESADVGFPVPPCDAAPSIGSNSGVVSSSFAGGKYTYLFFDTHLLMTFPPVFIEIALSSAHFYVQGLNLPGLPGVLMGATKYLGFGFTNNRTDVDDVYIEKLDSTRRLTKIAGKQVPIQHIYYPLKVRREDGTIDIKTVDLEIVPGHGPIFSTHIPALDQVVRQVEENNYLDHPYLALSYRWNGHGDELTGKGTTEYIGVMDMNRANTPDLFLGAAHRFQTGSQNMLYATATEYGFVTHGDFPVRPYLSDEQPPNTFVDSSEKDRSWNKQFRREVSQQRNSKLGRIVTANNAPYPGAHLYREKPENYLSAYFSSGLRAERIVSVLDANKGHIDLNVIRSIQNDHRANLELAFIEMLKESGAMTTLNGKAREIAELMLNWERDGAGMANRDRREPVVANEWLQICMEEHFKQADEYIDRFNQSTRDEGDSLMRGLYQTNITIKTLYAKMKARLADRGEAQKFFGRTLRLTAERLERNGKWGARWGEVNRLRFYTQLEGLLPQWFNFPLEKPGSKESVDCSANNVIAPNFRAILMFAPGEPVVAYNVLPGGNWGPLYPQGVYDELFRWRDGEQRPMIGPIQ